MIYHITWYLAKPVAWHAVHGCHVPSQRGSQHWIGSPHSCRYHSPPHHEHGSLSQSQSRHTQPQPSGQEQLSGTVSLGQHAVSDW
jgi:hypothetical protein